MRYNDISMVACDVDGTLLDSNSSIKPFTKDAVLKIQQKGVLFIIVTGRTDVMVKDIVKELNNTGIVIGCNGATIRNIITGELYMIEEIERSVAKELIDYFMQGRILFSFYTMSHGYYLRQCEEKIRDVEAKYFGSDAPRKYSMTRLDAPYDLLKIEEPFIKICVLSEDSAHILEQQKQLARFQGIEVFRPADFVLDIAKKSVSKGNALKQYANSKGILPNNIMAVGDGHNDISMLKYAGLGVAMKNATPELFRFADMITDSNENNGVGKILNKVFSLSDA